MEFLTGPNMVDLGAGEGALLSAARHSELIALYRSKGRHRQVLTINPKPLTLNPNSTNLVKTFQNLKPFQIVDPKKP
jgi:hypothetical protein